MVTRWLSFAIAVLLMFSAAIGCSGSGSPFAPDTDSTPVPGHSGSGKTALLGLYQVVIDKQTSQIKNPCGSMFVDNALLQ